MMQLIGIGAPFMEFFARFVVWLYMPAILCFLIAYRLLKESVLVFLLRRDLHIQMRARLALKSVFGALQGIAAGTIVFLCIYYRKELFQCVSAAF